jgi:PEP-CTERM motif
MSIRRPRPWFRRLASCGITALLVSSTGATAGPIIQLINNDASHTLSDLIVFGPSPLRPKQILLLNDDRDDIALPPNAVRTFFVGFEWTKAFVSIKAGASEFEAFLFKVTQEGPKGVGFLIDPATGAGLFASIDYLLAVEPLVDGTIVDVIGGSIAQLPGWFVGTGADFDVGDVTGAYTGRAQFFASGIRIAAIPEPASIALLGAGIAAGWATARRRRRNG